ncbi:peptidoglycan-binding domain-containing protein [Mycoplana dimorpha]|uniref:Putative peptidoglycan binding protein n=1 Tax=Mycoplana dimorpha TaxID=28320 RepID=A0A2T5B8S4_MYCDI|nr:peptidoglycan-binding protein [Mycoplana dimorpha]PTM95389.1 putative peptidoglycan binding protein [Mycoplana dimorpha]
MTHARFAKIGLAGLLGLALVGGAAVQAADTKPPVSAGKRWESEFSMWQKVSASSDPAGYQDYLDQYPNGTFASMARLRLAELNAAGVEKPSPETTGTTDDAAGRASAAAKAAEDAAAEKERAKAAEAQRLKAEQEAKVAAEKAQAEAQRQAAEAQRKREAEAVEAERRRAEQQEKAEEAHRKAEEQAKAAAEAKAKADQAAAARAKAEAEQAAAEAERKRAEAAAEAGRLKAEQEARAAAEAKAKADAAAADRARAEAALAEAEAERARAEEAAAAARLKAEEVARDNAEAKDQVATSGQPASPDSPDALDTEALPTGPEASPKTDTAKSADVPDNSAAQSAPAGEAAKSGPEAPAAPDAMASKEADATAANEADAEAAKRLARREDNSWSRAILNGSRDAYRAYLDEFPNGRFAADARQRLAAVTKESEAASGAEANSSDVATGKLDTGNSVAEADRSSGVAPEPAAPQPSQPRSTAQAPKVYQTPPDVREAWLETGIRAQTQRYLNALGYDTGGADGVFGPRTRAAIAAWQRSLGLRADGYLSRKQFLQLRDSAQFAENRKRQRAVQDYGRDPYYGNEYYLEGPADGYYEGPVDGYYDRPADRGGLYPSGPGY